MEEKKEEVQYVTAVIKEQFGGLDTLIKDVEQSEVFEFLISNHPYDFLNIMELKKFISYLFSNKGEETIKNFVTKESLLSLIEEFRNNNKGE